MATSASAKQRNNAKPVAETHSQFDSQLLGLHLYTIVSVCGKCVCVTVCMCEYANGRSEYVKQPKPAGKSLLLPRICENKRTLRRVACRARSTASDA